MLRPIPPHVAWQVIAALAGFFTLVCALAAPADLWSLTVKSRQGEPFLATATLASLPEEHISAECLSMGLESEAPSSALPFLSKAILKLDAARRTVEISTDEPMGAPALALVLRVQCAGNPLYARYFSALIPPALAKAQAHPTVADPAKPHGFHLSLLPGDSVESIAAVLFPRKRGMQQALVQQVIAGNPSVFANGPGTEVPAGTVLWFPDLREIRQSSQEKSSMSAKRTATHRPGVAAAEASDKMPARPREPVTLQRALELGDKPGPQECKQLMQLCGAESAAVAPIPTALDVKTQALESSIKELHLKQDSIDQQLQGLDQSIQALQKSVNSAPAQTPAAAPPASSPPKVEIRTVVKSEPVAWTIWLGLAGLIVVAAIGGFAYGRRGSFSRGLAETDEQLDRMLATAATVMRELESTPKPKPRPAPRTNVSMPAPTPRRPAAGPAAAGQPVEPSPPAGAPATAPDNALDGHAMHPPTDVDFKLESGPAAPSQIAGLSNDVLFEMDQALDNTRSMFTDVDRFIALGRTQNALSLLQFQVHKDPKDRDSWIKLMAIYRQEQMDLELAKAVREFRNHFPHENPPVV